MAPRPNGDNALTVTDWVLLGRYAARLDFPATPGEFQRADSAPKTTSGDGQVGIADWVQAGRYAVGLDPLQIAAGPVSESPIVPAPPPAPDELDHPSRRLGIQRTEIFHGLTRSVSVYLESLGNENAFGFSLDFAPDVLQFRGAALAPDCAHASLHLNTNFAHSGQIGVALAFPTGTAAKSGTQQLLLLNFEGVSAAPATSPLRFSDYPVNREVADSEATILPVDHLDGTLLLQPVPNLAIAWSGDTIELSWSASAGSFLLQESSSICDPAAWRTVAVPPVLWESRLSVAIPLENASRFYRLALPR